eukprot:scaffold9354_cov192-Ochromonas_danica.AAC.1
MSVVLQLPRDILHNIYSEWLGWKDLSRLDKAFVKKSEREEWLTSLTDLRSSKLDPYTSDNSMQMFIKWLVSRKVYCVDDFPIGVDVLEDLMTVLDMESYCPALRSIEITRWSINQHSSDVTHVENNLSIFLSHCHNLRGVTINVDKIDINCNYLSDIVLSVLIENLTENSLVKISFHNVKTNNRHRKINMMETDFITKHASSLRHLNISTLYEVDLHFIVYTLIENQIYLRVLTVHLGGKPLQVMPFLISYLSSFGGLLEDLEVNSLVRSFNAENLVACVAASCPKLTRLAVDHCEPCSIETLRRLYEQCPYLQYVSIGDVDKVIETDEKRKTMSIEVKGDNEDWVICLSHALRRRQYKKVTLRLREDNYYHTVGNLKSMLEPYHIHLQCFTHESSLISLLQDLPHLNSLQLTSTVNNQYTDATLAAISEHANSLTELKFDNIDVFDSLLSELIKACLLLERLIINDCGWESLVAIWKLSNLNMVDLTMHESVSEALLDGLLLNKKVKWSSSLEEGFIKTYEGIFFYVFIDISDGWKKCYRWRKRASG